MGVDLLGIQAICKLAIVAIQARMRWLEMLSPEQRAKVLDKDIENGQFWHDLLEPLRRLVEWIANNNKLPPAAS